MGNEKDNIRSYFASGSNHCSRCSVLIPSGTLEAFDPNKIGAHMHALADDCDGTPRLGEYKPPTGGKAGEDERERQDGGGAGQGEDEHEAGYDDLPDDNAGGESEGDGSGDGNGEAGGDKGDEKSDEGGEGEGETGEGEGEGDEGDEGEEKEGKDGKDGSGGADMPPPPPPPGDIDIDDIAERAYVKVRDRHSHEWQGKDGITKAWKRLKIQTRDKEYKIEGLVHKQLYEVAALMELRDHKGQCKDLWLTGDAGTGKSHMIEQIAKEKGLEFAPLSLNPQSPAWRIEGFKRPDGEPVITEFMRLYEHGGVFLAEEIANAPGSLLTALNSALANGVGNFSNGVKRRHKDFIFVGADNTVGAGGSSQYNGRQILDRATRDRFIFLEIEIDFDLERAIAESLHPDADKWIEWCQAVRGFIRATFPGRATLTPRTVYDGCTMFQQGVFKPERVAFATVYARNGWDADTIKKVEANVGKPPKLRSLEQYEKDERATREAERLLLGEQTAKKEAAA